MDENPAGYKRWISRKKKNKQKQDFPQWNFQVERKKYEEEMENFFAL